MEMTVGLKERQRADLELAKGEIQSAAVCGVDMIWGYADNQYAEQSSQIELAEHNIREAILLAVDGFRLEANSADRADTLYAALECAHRDLAAIQERLRDGSFRDARCLAEATGSRIQVA
jgi:hypothetical protein